MSTTLVRNSAGGYHFLPDIEPYSSGVIAEVGFEIVHATLKQPMSWHAGLCAARRYLESVGRDQHSLCGVELRCPQPHSMNGFIDFNSDYRQLLDEWQVPVNGHNPVARTNVAPVINPPAETVLFGFSYTQPTQFGGLTFVVAGGGELPTRALDSGGIVRVGDVSASAMREKAECVVSIMRQRMEALGAIDDNLSTIDVYTQHPLQTLFANVVAAEFPAAARLGVRWFYTRPPVVDIEFEMDMRGVRQDLTVDLAH